MRSPGILSVLALGAGAALLAPGVSPVEGKLGAAGGGLTILTDRDGDGLDDALELRLGTSADEMDSDFDEYSDLEEVVVGTDPLVPDPPRIDPVSSVHVTGYVVGNDFILSLYALRQNRVDQPWLHTGTEKALHSYRPIDIGAYVVDTAVLDTYHQFFEGWKIERMRIQVPRLWLDLRRSISFAVEALVDHSLLVDTFHVVMLGSAPAEFRWDGESSSASAGRGSGPGGLGASLYAGASLLGGAGGNGGALFPLEPTGEGAPANGEIGKACAQTVVSVGNLGDGRIVWEVIAADCVEVDQNPPAICISDCALSVGDEFTTIDVVGLLGG